MDVSNTTILIVAVAVIGLIIVISVISSANARKAEEERRQAEAERKEAELRQKRESLLAKYQDADVVDKLMRQTVWQGMTEEQVFDSLGAPLDIDQKVLKTKKKEIWKYNATGVNRYGVKISIENGLVVGWDVKD